MILDNDVEDLLMQIAAVFLQEQPSGCIEDGQAKRENHLNLLWVYEFI